MWHDKNKKCINDLHKISTFTEEDSLLYLKLRGANARATYDFKTNELTVLTNSKLALTRTNSFHYKNLLNKLSKNKIIVNNHFVHDYTFSSPSTAASIICKSNMNGKTSWLQKNGTNLKEVIEQNH